jgi:DNA-binding CsgD family transcriptional regulator
MGLFLSSTDLDCLRDLTQTLLSPQKHDGPETWASAVLRRLETLFNADRSLLFLPEPEGVMLVTESVPSELVPAFRSAFAQVEDGRLRSERPDVDSVLEARTAARMEVFTNQRLLALAAETPEMVPWYHDVIVPAGVHNGSGLALSLPVGEAWLCVAHSRPSDDPFGVEGGLELLALLLPAFRSGVEELVRGWTGTREMVDSLDLLGHAVVVFDLGGREILRSRCLDQLVAGDPDGAEVLRRARGMAAGVARLENRRGTTGPAAAGAGPHLDVITPLGHYQLRCAFVPTGTLAPDEAVMVAVHSPRPRLPSVRDLRHRYGLTGREAEITFLLAAGATNKQIAVELGISPHTVRTHIERIFRKLGVRSRKALGLKLLGLRNSGGPGSAS